MKLKGIITVLLALCLLCTALVACKEGENTDGSDSAAKFYTVTFVSAGGTEVEPKLVKEGTSVAKPETPEKDGYIFGGWFDGSYEWNFASKVYEDKTLTAKWISPESYYEYTPSADGKTAAITGLKQKNVMLRLPSQIGGYTVTAIADGTFEGLSSEEVDGIVIPDTVKAVGSRAFMNCTGIEITVEGELLSIGERAFFGCDGLSAVKLGEGLETVSAEAFTSTGISSIHLPSSLKTVDENAFDNCTSLKTVFMHDSTESVRDSAFYGTAIAAVYFFGSEDKIDTLLTERVNSRNDALKDAKIYIYSEAEPTANTAYDGFWHYDGNGKTKLW